MSIRLAILNAFLRRFERPALAKLPVYADARARFARQAKIFFPEVPGIRCHHCDFDGIPALVLRPEDQLPRATLLYLHGGGYTIGSAQTHRKLAAKFAIASGMQTVVPDYRLAPENPFPAAIDDCEKVYDSLVEAGFSQIALIGDSAGGGLVFALLHRLLARGITPFAAVGICPWTDLTLTGESHRRNAASEVTLPPERMEPVRDAYLAGASPKDPSASPLFGEFRGAPPCLIHASGVEILEDDSHRLAAHLRDADVTVTLRLWDKTPHVWHIYHDRLPEADAAIDDIGTFLRDCVSTK